MFFLLEFVLFKNASHSKDLSHKQTTCTATKSRYKKSIQIYKRIKNICKTRLFSLENKIQKNGSEKEIEREKEKCKIRIGKNKVLKRRYSQN